MDITTYCEKKYLITNTIQELYDEHTRNLEVLNQYKCESELEKKSLILTIKNQEGEIKNRDNTINRLEGENSKKNKQISEYEKMIRNLEDKMNELIIEKEEGNRFDMIRNQSNTIQEKENEIIRLTNLLKKREVKTDKTDNKIVNVLDSLISNDEKQGTIEVQEVEEDPSIEITVRKTEESNISTGKVTDEEISKKEESKESEGSEELEEEEEDYECLTYRGKQYWILVGEEPQYVYEIVGEDNDEVGDKLGVYKKTAGGKMKVFLDKK